MCNDNFSNASAAFEAINFFYRCQLSLIFFCYSMNCEMKPITINGLKQHETGRRGTTPVSYFHSFLWHSACGNFHCISIQILQFSQCTTDFEIHDWSIYKRHLLFL
uniref:Uncharacterized protein n=1 Tax=Rhizophora mucronata TaxID=61149 RepID=A0A2P2Q872_RHIMU